MEQKHLLVISLTVFMILGCNFSEAARETSPISTPSTQGVNSNTNKTVTFNTDENKNAAIEKKLELPLQQANAVCSDPKKPCQRKDKHFENWELSFKMPAKLQPNKPYKSAPFYALILKDYAADEDCDGGEYVEAIEAERKEEQANQPIRKVFASYQCPDMAAVDYDFAGKWTKDKESRAIGHFLAIYAGNTKAEADELLNSMKSNYPEAVVKQMTASYEMLQE